MGVIATFSYPIWAQTFPQFSNVYEGQVLGLLLPVAESFCANDGSGPANDLNTQLNMINLLVAHLAQLFFGSTTQPLSPLVGRISSATQGSVSVVVEMPTTPDAAWFNQTQYGAGFWAMSSIYRRFRVIPGCPQYGRGGWPGPWGGGGWNGGGLI